MLYLNSQGITPSRTAAADIGKLTQTEKWLSDLEQQSNCHSLCSEYSGHSSGQGSCPNICKNTTKSTLLSTAAVTPATKTPVSKRFNPKSYEDSSSVCSSKAGSAYNFQQRHQGALGSLQPHNLYFDKAEVAGSSVHGASRSTTPVSMAGDLEYHQERHSSRKNLNKNNNNGSTLPQTPAGGVVRNEHGQSLADMLQPITAVRLRPIRQKTRNAVVSGF